VQNSTIKKVFTFVFLVRICFLNQLYGSDYSNELPSDLNLKSIFESSSTMRFINYIPTKVDTLVFTKNFGITLSNDDYSPSYSFGLKFFENYYIYIKNQFLPSNNINKKNLIYHNGLIEKSRNNFSYAGFINKWLNIQMGKGNENWGAGERISLALSDYSNTYDYFLLASNYGRINVRYMHGFLEKTEDKYNRYITARGIEWNNRNSLRIGLSETVIYSGLNRSFDFSYINPISSHIELELNNRLNILGSSNSNAVWQFHYDYKINSELKFSLNYLIDEFVLDPNIEKKKEHGIAFSSQISYLLNIFNDKSIKLCASIVEIGTPTFRHGIGTNNFVQRGRPLGSQIGSDVQDKKIEIELYQEGNNELLFLSFGRIKVGQESINNRVFDSYDNYIKGKFPSGDVIQAYYFDSNLKLKFKNKYTFTASFYLQNNLNQGVAKNKILINNTIGIIYEI